MPSTAACIEQAFAQESGELFIACPRPSHGFSVAPDRDRESPVAEPLADRQSVGRVERQPTVLPTERAA